MAQKLRPVHHKSPKHHAELRTTQLWVGFLSLQHPGLNLLLSCVPTKSCWGSQALLRTCPDLAQGSVYAETRNPQFILISIPTSVTDSKSHPTQTQLYKTSSSFMFAFLCKAKTVRGQNQRRRRKLRIYGPMLKSLFYGGEFQVNRGAAVGLTKKFLLFLSKNHSSTLAWKIPWTEEPGGLQSMGSLRVRHDWATSLSLFTFMHWRRKWQPTPVFLPGESQGRRSLVGCCLWGHAESDMTDAT